MSATPNAPKQDDILQSLQERRTEIKLALRDANRLTQMMESECARIDAAIKKLVAKKPAKVVIPTTHTKEKIHE